MNSKVLQLHKKMIHQRNSLERLHRYYRGEHDIYRTYKKNDRSNEIEVHNFCRLFVDNNVGFLLGNGTKMNYQLNHDNEEKNIVDVYNERLGSVSQQHDQRLMQTQQIFGYTFEVNYITPSGEFAMRVITPLHMAVERDGKKVLYALYLEKQDEDKYIYKFFDVMSQLIYSVAVEDDKVMLLGDKPIPNLIKNPVIVVYNNWEKQSEFADIIGLNDAYNQVSSDLTNEISDHRNAYLHISGATIDDETLVRMKDSGIITTNSDSKVSFITKDINDTFVQNKLTQLKEQMYSISAQVDFNDTNLGSNTSSLALRNKLTTLINKLKLKEGFIREAHIIRLKNFMQFILYSENVNHELFDYKLVDIQFSPNIPTSSKEIADMVIQLKNNDLISTDTAMNELSMVADVRTEKQKIEREKEEELNSMDVSFLGDYLEEERILNTDVGVDKDE